MNRGITAALLTTLALITIAGTLHAQWSESVIVTVPTTGLEVNELDVEHNPVTGDDWLAFVQENVSTTAPNTVLVYRRAGGGPGPFTFVTSLSGESADFSSDASRLAIGATGPPPPGGPHGQAQTYDIVGSSLVLSSTVFDPIVSGDWGMNIAVDGNVLAVGSGSRAHIFRWGTPVAGTWNLEHTVNADPFDTTGEFTVAVTDMPGVRDVVMVGQPISSVAGPFRSGRVDFFIHTGLGNWSWNSWWHHAPNYSAEVGRSVDIDGDYAVAGAPRWSLSGLSGSREGATWIYRWNGSIFDVDSGWAWDPDRDFLGTDVAINGDTVVSGSPSYDGSTWPFDSAGIQDRGGAVVWTDNGAMYYPEAEDRFYTLSDVGGNGVPLDFGSRVCAYDAYDRLMCATADDGVNVYVIEYVLDRTTWRWLVDVPGVPGTNGQPEMRGEGTLADGETLRVGLYNARPNTTTFLVIGIQAWNLPFYAGTLVPAFEPPFGTFLALPTNGQGEVVLTAPMPDPSGLLAGMELHMQHWIVDPVALYGFASSNAIKGTIP